jgi:hypothetical protein
VVTDMGSLQMSANDMVFGTDGALWATTDYPYAIARINTQGVYSNYSDPSISSPLGITRGADGALWFTTRAASIGRITTDAMITTYTGPHIFDPIDITLGQDGALWFTSDGAIGRITEVAAPHLQLHPSSGSGGTTVRAGGTGFGAFEMVMVSFVDSTNGSSLLARAITDASGSFVAQVTIPDNATPGRQHVLASGLMSGIRKSVSFSVT